MKVRKFLPLIFFVIIKNDVKIVTWEKIDKFLLFLKDLKFIKFNDYII